MLALIINLDGESEKLQKSLTELKKANITGIRMSAIPGSSLNLSDSLIPNRNAAACWLSHIKSFQFLLDSNFDKALICEDDIYIRNVQEFKEVLNAALDLEFDIVQLGFLTHGILERAINFKKWVVAVLSGKAKVALKSYVPQDFLAGTHCYLISRGGAEKLIQLNQPPAVVADGYLQGVIRSGSVSGIRVRKSLVGQRPGLSSISNRYEHR